jgi:Xaa-Pro aminopeptidase
MDSEFFIINRKKLYDKMSDGTAVICFSGEAAVKLGDENYAFTPNRNFYYLTGLDEEKLVFFAFKKDNKTQEYIFVQRSDEVKAKWVGAVITPEEAEDISGVKEIKYIDEYKETVSNILFGKRISSVYLDLENRDFKTVTPAFSAAEDIRKNYPYINIENLHFVMAELRMIKEPCEVDEIRRAIDITKNGVYAMYKNAKPGMYEYQAEAYFDFELKKAGVRDFAFKSIVASGKNGTVLHYSDNDSIMEDGSLVLCDVGAQWNYYNGDITRTFPVNGKFTPRQRQIYDIVLGGHDLIIDTIRDGVEFASLNEILKKYYAEELKKIGLIKDDSEVSKYYYHGVSHLLGLETHDVGRHNEGLLREGMVLTVEPGLYIEEENIGIRIEDDVLVLKNGCEVLSKDIIRTADDIEKYMGGNDD